MSNKKFDIVGMADCCVNCTITVEKLPTHNEGSRTESMTFQGGGNVATGIVASARTGGRAGIPDLKTTLQFIETGEIDYTEIDERVKLYGISLAYT